MDWQTPFSQFISVNEKGMLTFKPYVNNWFVQERIDNYIRITEPNYRDYCNCWFLPPIKHRENAAILIDVGTGANDLYAYLLASGLIAADTILTVIVTHQHSDHAGGLRHFAGKPNVTICCHQGDVDALTQGHDEVGWAIKASMWKRPPYQGFKARSFVPLVPVAIDRILQDGDLISGLRVIWVPGHTPGSIALLDAVDRSLFNGDTAYAKDTIVAFPSSNKADACQSMVKLLELGDVYDKAYPGHWNVLSREQVNRQCNKFLAQYKCHELE